MYEEKGKQNPGEAGKTYIKKLLNYKKTKNLGIIFSGWMIEDGLAPITYQGKQICSWVVILALGNESQTIAEKVTVVLQTCLKAFRLPHRY